MTHAPTRPMPYRVDVYHLGKSYFVEDGAGWIDGDPNEVREFPFREQAIRFARKQRDAGHCAQPLHLVKATWVDAEPEGWWDTDYDSLQELGGAS